MKKLLSVLLCLVFLIGLLPLSVIAANATEVASGTCGASLTWSLDSDGTLTVSGTGAMNDYNDDGNPAPWYTQADSITSAVVEDGVTSIGSYAFNECMNMESVTIPTSVTCIGDSAFSMCFSLVEAHYGGTWADWNGVTVSAEGDNGDFLTDGIIRYATLSGTCGTSLTWTLDGGSGLLTISGTGAMSSNPWSTDHASAIRSVVIESGATGICSYAFRNCVNLSGAEIPASVTEIQTFAFSGCTALEDVTIPTGVMYIRSNAFSGCTALIDIAVPGSVRIMESSVFKGCTGLLDAEINAALTSKIISDALFSGCSALERVRIPENITQIGNDAFSGCGSLSTVIYPGSAAQWNAITIGNNNTALTGADVRFGSVDVTFDANGGTGTMEPQPIRKDTATTLSKNVFTRSGYAFIGWNTAADGNGTDYADEASVTLTEDLTLYARWQIRSENDWVYDIIDGDRARIVRYNGPGGDETVPATLGGHTVTAIGDGAFRDCASLTGIAIPAGVTSIGEDAFSGCGALEYAAIPAGVTSIGNGAFQGCEALTGISIPAGAESIGEDAFNGCGALEYAAIPAGAEIDDDAFNGCEALTDVYYGGRESEVPYVAGLTGEQIRVHPLLDSDTLGSCGAGLTWAIYAAGENGAETGILRIAGTGDMVSRDSFGNTDSYLDHMTRNSSVASAVIERGVTSIGERAFLSCDALESVTIPAGVTNIGEWAFYGCGALESVTIPAGVTGIGGEAFGGCGSLTAITVDPNNEVYQSRDGVLLSKDGSTLLRCPGGKAGAYEIPAGVTSLSFGAFSNCAALTAVTIPAGVAQLPNSAFDGCEGLTRVTIPAGVTAIGRYAFFRCGALRDVYYSGTETQWQTLVGENLGSDNEPLTDAAVHYFLAYGECGAEGDNLIWLLDRNGVLTVSGTGAMAVYADSTAVPWAARRGDITAAVIGDGVTNICSYAFTRCTALAGVTIGSGVTGIGDSAFSGCTALTGVTIGSGVTGISGTAFSGCTALTAFTVAEGNTAFSSVDGVLLKNGTILFVCPAGKAGAYVIPDGVTSINSTAFSGCTALTAVTLPASMPGLGPNAFNGCRALKSVTIPASVMSIGDSAFSGCTALTDIYFCGTPEQWTELRTNHLNPTNNAALTAAAVHYPCTVTFDANGGAGTTEPLSAWTGVPTALTPNAFTREGYNFTGWNTASDGSGDGYADSAEVTLSGDLTLYAQWGPVLAITGQPQDVTAAAGKKVTFTVTAAGTGTLTYQWQYSTNGTNWNNTALTGCNTKTLTVTASSTVNGRYYRCIVTDSKGSVTSNAAKLTVTSATGPSITGQPQDRTVAAGARVTFTVTATGAGTLSYQWQWSADGTTWANTSLTGCNTKTLTVTASATVNGRYYRCVVTDANGTVNSAAARLTVVAGPTITAQPKNRSVGIGSKAYFTLTATGKGTLKYQWQYSTNGTAWYNTSLTGCSTATLTVTASAAINGRYYRCVVSDDTGSVNSDAARLFVTSPGITEQPKDVSVTAGSKASFTVKAMGTGTLTYQWQYSLNGATWYNTSLTGYNTPTLTITASSAVNGRYYRCVVTDSKGSVNSAAARLTVVPGPTITKQPASVTATAGSKATFTVTATGSGNLTYQWQYSVNGTTWNNTALTGYNTPTLTITASAAVNGRYYRCVVTDANGSVNSAAAKLTVT